MKKLNKILVLVICGILFIGKVSAKDKIKVYIFEAGGCPYCEAEIKYLKELDSYNKKFEIVTKELYIDHVDWEQGKDYDLGVKVATAFKNKGYEDASYQGTPFVVIGNIYAVSSYSTELKGIIDTAYENENPDIVECFINNEDNCEEKINNNKIDTYIKKERQKETKNNIFNILMSALVIIILIVVLLKLRSNNKKVDNNK